jgi:hypothetical protein
MKVKKRPIFFTFALALSIVVSLAGCEYSGGTHSKRQDLKVKGLYLGMDIKDVPAILKEYFGDDASFEVSDVRRSEFSDGFCVKVGTYTSIFADVKGIVETIWLEPPLINRLFNVQGIDATTYAKNFINSYKIPEMQPIQDPNISGWQYSSPVGFKVTIFADKTTTITAIPILSEQKFD